MGNMTNFKSLLLDGNPLRGIRRDIVQVHGNVAGILGCYEVGTCTLLFYSREVLSGFSSTWRAGYRQVLTVTVIRVHKNWNPIGRAWLEHRNLQYNNTKCPQVLAYVDPCAGLLMFTMLIYSYYCFLQRTLLSQFTIPPSLLQQSSSHKQLQ